MTPEGWMVRSVGSLATFASGQGINVAELAQDTSVHSIPVYGGNGIAGYTANALIKEPTVVVGRVGQKCGEVYNTNGPAWITDNALYPKQFHEKISIAYFSLALKSIGLNSVKNRNDLPLVTQSILHSVLLNVPPHSEQRAIASALSDVDALLAALDRHIAKKRDLKQAAMQQLLTGQTRLPGFKGEWDKKLLGELGSTFGGLVGKSKSDFGAGTSEYVTFLNVISNTIIDATAFERVNVSVFESQNRLKRGDLVFNGSSETPEEVALCALLSEDHDTLFLNSFCFGFRFHDLSDINGLFLVYYLRSKVGREIMKSLAQGSTRYNLSKPALLKAEVLMPTVQEQNEIATVLSDMDAELATLEQRLAKTRALKQGMMQELLTGRIRLVTPQSSPKVAHA